MTTTPAPSKSVIAYDRELPEIPDRRPWEKPASFLVKAPDAPNGYREDTSGRRPSPLLLVPRLREQVDAWRDGGYPGASDVTRELFTYWFEHDHQVPGFEGTFRYHFCQREAIETLVYVVEVLKNTDLRPLLDTFATLPAGDLFATAGLEYQTTMDGHRQVRRPTVDRPAGVLQELPPENLRRYATKIATGGGKTWVMAMAVVWSYFHKRRVPGSDLSTNFLIVAPNVIVFQRLQKEFDGNYIFSRLPLVPPAWKGQFGLNVVQRDEAKELEASGNLVLTNVQQLYQAREKTWTATNPVQAMLGPAPSKDLTSYQRPLLERLRGLPDLVAINDEAHHVHDKDLAWSQSLLDLHAALPHGLALWLDFSATPKDQGGTPYPWILSEYPLAQAVEDRIVKAPLIVDKADDPRRPSQDPEGVNRDNLVEKYGFWLHAAVERWQAHREAYRAHKVRPLLFVVTENNAYADAIGKFFEETPEFGFKKGQVLVIHTDTGGEVRKGDLETARQAARDVDQPRSRIKVIVSVMMLKEGWDVRNVSVVLGLRPFTAAAEILPEQVIGRGLRLMQGITPDRTQTLEVLGTKNLLDVLRRNLEAEGVSVGVASTDPPPPVSIYPIQQRQQYDIAIPLTQPVLSHNVRQLSAIDPLALGPIYDQSELDEPIRLRLKMEFATTETEVHQADVAGGRLPLAQELVGSIARKVAVTAQLSGQFAELYPLVRRYVAERCFGITVDLDDEAIRGHLRNPLLQEGIAGFLAKQIGRLTVEERPLQFQNQDFRLSQTRQFTWRRNLPPLACQRTIFNYVATYNNFERTFAQFLDTAPDVLRFASLGTTEQGDSFSTFRVDYLKPSGAIGYYYPDWAVVQQTSMGEVHWIVETKGRVWQGTDAKDRAIRLWCDRVTQLTGTPWRFVRVNQADYTKRPPVTFADLERFLDPVTP